MCKTQFKNNLCVLAIVDSHFKEPMPGLQKGSVQYNHALAHAHPQNWPIDLPILPKDDTFQQLQYPAFSPEHCLVKQPTVFKL